MASIKQIKINNITYDIAGSSSSSGSDFVVNVKQTAHQTLTVEVAYPNKLTTASNSLNPILSITLSADLGYTPGNITIDGVSVDSSSSYSTVARNGMVISAEQATVSDKKPLIVSFTNTSTSEPQKYTIDLNPKVTGSLYWSYTDDYSSAKKDGYPISIDTKTNNTVYFYSDNFNSNDVEYAWNNNTANGALILAADDSNTQNNNTNIKIHGSLGGLVNLTESIVNSRYNELTNRYNQFKGLFAGWKIGKIDASELDLESYLIWKLDAVDYINYSIVRYEKNTFNDFYYGWLNTQSCSYGACTYMFASSNITILPTIPTISVKAYIVDEQDEYPQVLTSSTTAVANYQYQAMFYACNLLTDASNIVLSAAVLSKNCYDSMFTGCSKLVKGPLIKARYARYDGFSASIFKEALTSMYLNCGSLKSITCLLEGDLTEYIGSNTVASQLMSNWIKGVSSTGTFYKAKGSTWPTPSDSILCGIPMGWTVVEKEVSYN